MKISFIETGNVKQFISTSRSLENTEAGVPGLGLVWGSRGLGKTETAIWFAARPESRAKYVLAKREWTYGWMMEDLAIELGLTPQRNKKAAYDLIVNALVELPRLLIIDEINLPPVACLETLRGINDATRSPILFIGHEGVTDRLKRLGPLWDRILYITEFKPLAIGDLRLFAQTCLDMPVDSDVLESVLRRTEGNFRRSVVALKGSENRAKAARASKISLPHLRIKRAA